MLRRLLTLAALCLGIVGGLPSTATAATAGATTAAGAAGDVGTGPAGAVRRPATAGATATTPTVQPPGGSVVLIGTGGLTWSDISEKGTPTLWTLMRDGSGAAMTIRSVETNTCPVDGWLGLSAGQRAAAPRAGRGPVQDRPCPALPDTATLPDPATRTSVTVPGWSSYLSAAASRRFDARLGLLAATADTGRVCTQAVGPGAGIAAAMPNGSVARWSPWEQGSLLEPLNTCPLTLVDVGAVRDPAEVAKGETGGGPRAAQVAAIDQRIAATIAAAPGGADIVVASLSDAGTQERLRLVVARGPHFGPGELRSSSTRQPGLVQSADLTATLLSLVGVAAPTSLGGAELTTTPAPDNSTRRATERLRSLVDYDQASHEVHSLVEPFFQVFAYGQLAIYLLVLLVWKGRIGSETGRLELLRRVRVVAVCAAAVPASTFLANLVPWWRFPVRMLGVVVAVAVFVAVIAWLALSGPWGRAPLGPMAAVSAVTLAVLAGDVMTGSRLQLSSLMGLQPVIGGRFYGMGNVTFALFATSAMLLATVLSSILVAGGRRKLAAVLAVAVLLAALVIDGMPFWGADGGGPPALLPGTIYLILAVLQIRLTWQRALLAVLGSVLVFVAIAIADWARGPSNRTHLGGFVQAVLDGTGGDIVVRKAQQNLAIITGNAPLTVLVPVALLFVWVVLARPTSWGARALQRSFDHAPTLRHGLIALLVTLTIAFAINDSGIAIPAVGATVAIPLLVSVALKTLEDDARAVAPTRRARRG